MLFTVAKPLEKDDFLRLYRNVAKLTKLLFAPFGLHPQVAELLGQKAFIDTYAPIYQQLEDVLSKCIFRSYGFDDDQIVATMHKFVGQTQDRQVIDEIKPAPQALVSLLSEMEVVEYDLNNNGKQATTDDLFDNEALYLRWLTKLISALNQFYDQVQVANHSDSVDKANIDEAIKRHFQMMIGIRLTNPILELHHFSLESPREVVQETIQTLFSVFLVPTIDTDGNSNLADIELSYPQLAALHEVYSSSSSTVSFSSVIKQLLIFQLDAIFGNQGKNRTASDRAESTLFVSEHQKGDYHINQFRSGELFPLLNRFLDPTMSFVLQMSDWLQYNQSRFLAHNEDEPDRESSAIEKEGEEEEEEIRVKRKKLVGQGETSLEFVLLALERLQQAKEEHESGATETAIETLSDQLLDRLFDDDINSDGEDEQKVIVPAHTQVLLLLDRTKYHLEIGDVISALIDLDRILLLDAACASAYALRSQILLASFTVTDPAFVAAMETTVSPRRIEESKDCLLQLIPSSSFSSSSLLPLEIHDLRMHGAAEDALLAFLLGGSSDLALAAAAEEAARETCRKFAKTAFAMKLNSRLIFDEDMTSASKYPTPRLWLLQSYYSGYELLSLAMGLYGESSYPLVTSTTTTTASSSVDNNDIDETTPEERDSQYTSLPPNALVDGQVITERDRVAYSLLCQLVDRIETALVTPLASMPLTPEMEAMMKQANLEHIGGELGSEAKEDHQVVYTSLPVEEMEELNDEVIQMVGHGEPQFHSPGNWTLTSYGRVEELSEDEISHLKVISPPFTTTTNTANPSKTEAITPQKIELSTVLSEEATISQLTSTFREVFTLLQKSSEVTGVIFAVDGKVHEIVAPYTPFDYSSVLAEKQAKAAKEAEAKQQQAKASANKQSKQKKTSKGKDDFQQGFMNQFEGFEEMPEELKAMFGNMASQYEDMFGGEKGEEEEDDDDDSGEWEDMDDDEDEEEEEQPKKSTSKPEKSQSPLGREKKEGKAVNNVHNHNDNDEDEEEESESEIDVEPDTDDDDNEPVTSHHKEEEDDTREAIEKESTKEDVEHQEEEEEEEVAEDDNFSEDPNKDLEEKFSKISFQNIAKARSLQSKWDQERYIGSTSSQFGTSNNSVISSTMKGEGEEDEQEDEDDGGVDGISQLHVDESVGSVSEIMESVGAVNGSVFSADHHLSFSHPSLTVPASAMNSLPEEMSPGGEESGGSRNPNSLSSKLQARLLNLCGSFAYLAGDALGAVKCFEGSLFYDSHLLDSEVKLAALLIDLDEMDKAEYHLSHGLLQYHLQYPDKSESEDPVVFLLHYAELEINRNDFTAAVKYLRKADRYLDQLRGDESNGWGGFFGMSKQATPSSTTPFWDYLNRESSEKVSYPPLAVRSTKEEKERRQQSYLHCYEHSYQLLHSNVIALLGVSLFRSLPTQPESAMRTMEAGLQKYPHSSILLLCAGEIHSQCGDMTKSIKLFHKAHLLDPFHPLPLINAARTYQQLGELQTALLHIQMAMQCDPDLAMTRVDYAQLLRQLHRIEEAVVMIDEAYRMARHVSEIKDVLVAKYVTQLQQMIKKKGILVM